MSSIYGLDPKIRKLLSLDNFLDNMSVYEFIEELGKDHSAAATTTSGKEYSEVSSLDYLDPKPFIRTFESTLKELSKLNAEALSRKEMIEKDIQKYESDHNRNILSLSSKTESVNNQFQNLDDKITNISSLIQPLNTKLTKTVNSKERTIDTISLIRIYNDFYKNGHSKELDFLINGNYQDKRNCSKKVSNLLSLSKKLISNDLTNSAKCYETIQKYSETMENSLLEDFNIEYRANNLNKMKEISDILTEFNGGIAVITNFINQNEVFLNNKFDDSSVLTNIENNKIWETLSNPQETNISLPDSFVQDFFNEIETIIENETRVIIDIFKDSVKVLSLFIQRIFAQFIQSRIQLLLKTSYSTSSLAYLRTLNSLYLISGNFIKNLKYNFQSILKNEKLVELNNIIDQSNSDLFTEHLNDNKYIELEKKSLESIFYQLTNTYETLNENKIQNKLINKLFSNKTVDDKTEYDSLNRTSKVGQLKSFMKSHLDNYSSKRLSSLSMSNDESIDSNDITYLDIKVAEIMIRCSVESLSRILELTPFKVAEHGYKILQILLIGIGKSYVDLGLEVSYTDLLHQDYKNDIEFKFLNNIKNSSEILYLISSCIRTIILPLSNNSPQLKTKMTNLTNSYVLRVENSINIILQDTLLLCENKILNALSKQKKKDFLPNKLDELVDTDTLTCEILTNFLNEVYLNFQKYLNGENFQFALIKIASFTYDNLFEHFKKFEINSIGGIVLTKDIISYQSTIETWKIPELNYKFQNLREIANLFTVQPELINSLVKEGQLANIKPYVLRQFIMKRSDYNTNTSYVSKLRGYI